MSGVCQQQQPTGSFTSTWLLKTKKSHLFLILLLVLLLVFLLIFLLILLLLILVAVRRGRRGGARGGRTVWRGRAGVLRYTNNRNQHTFKFHWFVIFELYLIRNWQCVKKCRWTIGRRRAGVLPKNQQYFLVHCSKLLKLNGYLFDYLLKSVVLFFSDVCFKVSLILPSE